MNTDLTLYDISLILKTAENLVDDESEIVMLSMGYVEVFEDGWKTREGFFDLPEPPTEE